MGAVVQGPAPAGSGGGKVLKQIIQSYTYVVIWMALSILVIMFNKWVLAYSGFPFPMALVMWHMFFCSAVGFLAVRVFKVVKSHNMSTEDYCRRVLPIGLLYAGSLWLSNSAYLYLSVSFIQMTKSLMPGLVYASGCFVGTEKFKGEVAAIMSLIAFGVVVCAIGEVNLVVLGVVVQLASLAFEALRLTLVQVLMNSKGYNMNPMQSLYYVSPACLLCLIVPFFAVELPRIQAAKVFVFNPPVLLANAFTALILNLAVFMLIGKTSALTMNIAGVIKDWMLIYCSYYVFKAPLTFTNLFGYVFCCSGVVWYNQVKLKALKQKAAAAAELPGSSKSDIEKPLLQQRNKDDILGEIRRLQAEMSALDTRVESSSKMMGMNGLAAIKVNTSGSNLEQRSTAAPPSSDSSSPDVAKRSD